jgi:arsenate reductase
VIEYLKSPLERSDLERFLNLLPDPPTALVRKDKNFEHLELSADDYQTRDQVIDLLLKHPKLMQRPVCVRGDRAVIARPSGKILELLD